MSKKLIYKKGLLLKVVSWENDADHYQTTETNMETLEEAKAYQRMFLELFKSENNGDNGIGNSFDDKEERIEEFRLSDVFFKEKYTKEEFFDFINDSSPDYMGHSVEGYDYRICETCEIFEVKEDVFLNKIKID